MIGKTAIAFLKDLQDNNNKEWFQDNKERYEGRVPRTGARVHS